MIRDILHLPPAPIKAEAWPLAHVPHDQLNELQQSVTDELRRRRSVKADNARWVADLNKLEPKSGKNLSRKFREKLCANGVDLHIPHAIHPEHFTLEPSLRLRCLGRLLKQDWSSLWPPLDQNRKYYVYAHVDPGGAILALSPTLRSSMRMPFYIGKGCGDRAYNLSRNQGHGLRLRKLLDAGATRDSIVSIIKADLTENEALELEAKLVYFFGRIYDQKMRGVLLNLDPCLRPDFQGVMPLFRSNHFKGETASEPTNSLTPPEPTNG